MRMGMFLILACGFALLWVWLRRRRSGLDQAKALRDAERGRMEDELRQSRDKFYNIFHLSPDAIDLTQLETGVFLELNHGYEILYGYSRQELLGRSTLPGDTGIWVNRADRARHVEELKEHGISLGFEAPQRRKDGTPFVALISSAVSIPHARSRL